MLRAISLAALLTGCAPSPAPVAAARAAAAPLEDWARGLQDRRHEAHTPSSPR